MFNIKCILVIEMTFEVFKIKDKRKWCKWIKRLYYTIYLFNLEIITKIDRTTMINSVPVLRSKNVFFRQGNYATRPI